MSDQTSGALLRPSTFVTGGLVDDVDATLTEVRFALWDYNGKIPQPVLALKVVLSQEDGAQHEQFFSAGDQKYFVPSKDGKRALPVGDKTALNSNSNAGEFLASIVNCGFPEDKIEDDVSVFEGMVVHVNRKAQAKRAGLQTGDTAGREKTVLVVTKILRYPWDQKKVGAKSAAAKGAPGKAGSAPVDVDDELTPIITGILAVSGTLKKQALVQAVFKEAARHPQRSTLVKRANEDAFLEAGQAAELWLYDGESITGV